MMIIIFNKNTNTNSVATEAAFAVCSSVGFQTYLLQMTE